MSKIIQITKAELLDHVYEGDEVYAMKKITSESRLIEVMDAEAYVVLEDAEPEACEPEQEETMPEPEQEEAEIKNEAEQTLPAKQKRKYPAKKKSGRKEIDHGKIIACRRAGWSVAKIADELGCTAQTVYSHLNREGMD